MDMSKATNQPDQNDCTADLAITLMLMVTRRIDQTEDQIKPDTWASWCPSPHLGRKMSGKTLGIIGFDHIGQEVAKRAHNGFNMRIIAYDPSPIPEDLLIASNVEVVDSIDALLPRADYVSLHKPGHIPEHISGSTPNSYLIDDRRLNLMKPTAYLINTARGPMVDHHALKQALWFETIAGAGLNEFDHPSSGQYYPQPGLESCDNAVLLPHLHTTTQETHATRETHKGLDFQVT